MRSAAVAIACVALLACKKEPTVDCKAIAADPGTALQRVMDVTSDPAKVYEILEQCFAPNGDVCERAAVDGQMVPSMAITDGSAGDAVQRSTEWKSWAAKCRQLAPEMQQCLLLSYALGHPDCANVAAQARDRLK